MYENVCKQDPFTKEYYPQSIYHDQKQLKVVGNKDIGRDGIMIKLQGKALFANDIQMSDILYLQFKRSPYSHAKIKKIDTSKAKALDGVVMVLTHDDIPDLMVSAPYGYLLSNEVWLEGDEVAAVAAVEESIAEEALSLIEVEYEQLPFVLYCEDAQKEGSYILHGTTNEVVPPATMTHKRGDVETGFAQADKVLEGKYHSLVKPWTGARDHGTIEAESFTVYWDGEFLNSWTSLKNVYDDWKTLASIFNLPLNKVRMPATYCGCNWGSAKGGLLKGEVMAAYMSMKTNRPVKCYAGTEAKFNATGKMADQHHAIKVGVNNDGTLVAISDVTVNNTGPFGGTSAEDCHTSDRTMWTVPNLYLEGHDAYTNTPRVTSVRCVHHPHATTQMGLHMDKVAEAVGMDPADFLLKNSWKAAAWALTRITLTGISAITALRKCCKRPSPLPAGRTSGRAGRHPYR
jgi:xanthine dehydrogenase molybdenum-binding subunit